MLPLVLPNPDAPAAEGAVAALRRARAARLGRDLADRVRTREAANVLRSLDRVGQTSRGDLVELLSDPGVGVLVDTGRAEDALFSLAFELACRGELGESVTLSPRALWSARHDLLLEPATTATELTLRSSELELRGDGARVTFALARDAAPRDHALGRLTRAFPSVRDGVVLALFDPNPLSSVEAHPEKHGNPLSLGGQPESAWLDALRSALETLARELPELWAEMQSLLRFVIPTGADAERQQSASYREYVGALYVTLHPQTLSTAEALIHEFQHNKLNLCAQHYELIENAYSPLYPSPIRPDPRPLMGVLLAAHAFVPVAELYRRLLARDAHPRLSQRLAEIVSANDEALSTLGEHARYTLVGAHVHAELTRLHGEHLALGLSLPERVAHVA